MSYRLFSALLSMGAWFFVIFTEGDSRLFWIGVGLFWQAEHNHKEAMERAK